MSPKIAVVGGGLIGLSCAYYLGKRGAEVVVLERGTCGGGCSAGNAGWVVPSISLPLPAPGLRSLSILWMLSSDSPLYVRPTAVPHLLRWLWSFWQACNHESFELGAEALMRHARESMELFEEWRTDGVDFEWVRDGLLMAFRTEAAMGVELELLRRFEYGPHRVLSAEELYELEPVLDQRTGANHVGGVHVGPEAHVRPESLCSGLAARCSGLGVELREGFAVDRLGFDRSVGGRARSVLAGSEEVEADVVVLATGAEAGRLARQCGTRLPLTAGKGYSVTIGEPETKVCHPLYLAEAKLGVTPFEDALRVAGTLELSGINNHMAPKRLASLERAAEREIPGFFEGSSRLEWVGMRPVTPDGLPVLGRLPGLDNVYVNSGHQMLGVTLAPASGRAMATLVLDGDGGQEAGRVAPFDPARFVGRS